MPIFLEEVEFVPEDVTASTFTDYLKGNIFQKINLRIQFRSEHWIEVDVLNILFADPAFKTDDWISCPTNLNAFNGFNVDDELRIAGTASNNATFIISEKLNNQQMRLTDNLGAPVTLTNVLETAGRINLVQDPDGITVDFSLIENQEAVNFDSKVTQDLMRFQIQVETGSFLPIVTTPMLPVGLKDWQLGAASLKNLTSGSERDGNLYQFEFTQELYIHPFFLPNQLLDLQNEFPIAPKYFRKEKCLRYVARIRAYREIQDPNVFQEGIIDEQNGQTGWFGEDFNGGTSFYNFDSLVYDNNVNAIDPRQTTTITFNINLDPSLLNDFPTWVTLNFIVLPEDDNDYKNRDQLQQENFVWDSARNDVGSAAVNGVQNGGGYQVIQNMTVTNTATNTVEVEARINFGADALAKINTLANGGYMIAAYTNFGTTETADRCHFTTLLIDLSEMETEVTYDIVEVTTEFIRHDKDNTTDALTTNTFKVEDEIVAESLILIDHTPTSGYPGSQIDSFSSQIVAKKSGEDDVILLNQDFSLIGQPLVGGLRELNTSPTTGFNVNPSEVRYNFRAFRSRSDDSGTEFAYRVQYPFLYRWENWEQLLLALPPNDWFDAAEDHNGYNNDWLRIAALSGWSISHRLETKVDFQGTTRTINHDELLTTQDYLAGTNWSTEEVESLDGIKRRTCHL